MYLRGGLRNEQTASRFSDIHKMPEMESS